MEHTIDWYIGLARELEWDFRPRNELFGKIDDMVRPTWSLPASFTETVKNVMAVIDPAPSDTIHSGAIAFSGSDPVFHVTPFMPNVAEYDRAQSIEDNISWHFKRANRRGNGTMMYDLAESTLKYNTSCIRVDDLVRILPKKISQWTALQKRAWRVGRFIHKVVHPATCYYAESDLGVTTVIHIEAFRVLDIIKHYELFENMATPEGAMIASALKSLKDKIGYNGQSADRLREMYFMQTYCIDDDRLMTWGSVTGNVSGGMQKPLGDAQLSVPTYIFADQKNPYGFIPWSIRVAGSRLESKMEYRVNPLLAPLYWSGAWDKLNLARSIIFSEPIRRAQTPRMATFTDSGDAPEIDYENGGDINLRKGEDVKGLQPITLDQGAMAIVQQLATEMNRTTGASMIGDTTQISTRTTFATFQAMYKIALSRLDKQLRNMALACEDVAMTMMSYVNLTNVPLTSFAESDKQYRSGRNVPLGMLISTTRDDYNLDSLEIKVKIKAYSPVDEMEQLNKAILLSTKLNVPASQVLEEIGYENIGPMYELWVREFLRNAQVQAEAAGMMAKAQGQAQLDIQQEAQQNQQGSQGGGQQPPEGGDQGGTPGGPGGGPAGMTGANQGISNTSFGQLGGGQGMNPAMGGMSPTLAAPTQTREKTARENPYTMAGRGI